MSTELFSELTCKGEGCSGYIKVFTHIAAVISLYFFAIRVYHQEKQVDLQITQTKNQEKQIQLQIKHRVDDRFKSSIELLGGEEISVRVGGIYSLFYLATEEEKYKDTIANILCSHIRSKTQNDSYRFDYKDSPSNEIQITIDLLFKENSLFKNHFEKILHNANLTNSYLVGADFNKSECRYIDFERSNLEGCNFDNANCKFSNFEKCNCKDATFTSAIMEDTILDNADFSNVEFSFCSLNNSSTYKTDFSDAKFHDTNFKNVHCSLDAKYSNDVKVNLDSLIEKEVHKTGFKPVSMMIPMGDYIINPSAEKIHLTSNSKGLFNSAVFLRLVNSIKSFLKLSDK